MSDKPKVRLSAKGIPVGKMGRFKRRERFDLLASWYGSERAAVEISSHTCQPVAIKDLVNEVMLEPGRRNNSNIIAGLQSQWKQLVGGCPFLRFLGFLLYIYIKAYLLLIQFLLEN